MATDYEGLIPRGVASSVIAAVEQESVALRLGQTQPMPAGAESIPVVAVEPVVEWTDPRYGGRKAATKIEWTAAQLEAEELACVLAIPSAWVDDAGFPVWDVVQSRLASAVAKRIDSTLLFAVAPVPASFPPGGVVAAAGTAVTGADTLAAIDAALAKVEGEGLNPTGIASSTAINSALRKAYAGLLVTPEAAPQKQLYGLEVGIASYWDSTAGDAIVGDWSKLVIGVREDIRFELSDSAILQDDTGAIIANAFQDDLVAMRCYMRMGAAIGKPVGADGTPVEPFAIADWTP